MLLIDAGNSRIKAARREGGSLRPLPALATRAPADFADWADESPAPPRILVSNVAGADVAAALTAFAVQRWRLTPEFVRPERSFAGMTTRYANPHQLGVDRWLAALAGFHLGGGPVCVVDAGTALTVDVVLGDGTHLGGLIAPGPELMRASLTRGTAQLASDGIAEVSTFADNMHDAISLGCTDALAGLIDRVAARLPRVAPGSSFRWFLTGGGAPALLPLVPAHCEHVPDLVLRGLALHADASP
jgi:type III pantothenate kinase